jgi:hypothetical protein
MPLLGARLNLPARFDKLAQTLLASRQFIRYRYAVGNIRRVRRLGFGHKIRDLGPLSRLGRLLAKSPHLGNLTSSQHEPSASPRGLGCGSLLKLEGRFPAPHD